MKKIYIPDRNDIIWMDFEPTKGKEIGKYRPALVLSSKLYQEKKSVLICCSISTTSRGHNTEVPIYNLEKKSFVVASMVQTMSWKNRKVKFIAQAEVGVMTAVLQRLIPLLGAEQLLLETARISR